MSHYDDSYSSSEAYQDNVALPDQRAFAKAAEARGEQMLDIETYKRGYRCQHEEEPYRTPRAIVVGLDSQVQVLVDVCAACMRKIKAKRG